MVRNVTKITVGPLPLIECSAEGARNPLSICIVNHLRIYLFVSFAGIFARQQGSGKVSFTEEGMSAPAAELRTAQPVVHPGVSWSIEQE